MGFILYNKHVIGCVILELNMSEISDFGSLVVFFFGKKNENCDS